MSVPERALRLAAEARQDLSDILLYTERHWGRQQRDTYESQIYQVFALILNNPQIGVSKEAVRPGMRARRADHHILYYRIRDDEIEIVRILHERMDAARHLAE